ncbi:MAG: hypothetical protein HZA92_07150 [Verrucomicrobia bacterium]|nr:hypothetical protein [Verrucomicrobiota bacterium]
MAKRSSQNLDEGVNMDSMMDNMTNVVGTLLLVLIIVTVGVKSTADKVEKELANVTPQQVQQAKQQLEQNKAAAKKSGANQEIAAQQAKAKQDDLRAFEMALDQKGIKVRDLESLQKDLLAKRAVEATEKQAMSGLLGERDNLRAALDKTPMPKGPPPVDVRVPVAKAIPTGAVMYRVLCMSNKVYMISEFGWRSRIWTELQKTKYDLLHEKQPADTKAGPVFDQLKTVNWLNERKFTDDYVELRFPLNTNSTTDRVHMQIFPRKDGGEGPDEVDNPESKFRKMLITMRANPKLICWFWVHPTGVAAYHAGREQCSRYGIPAGWEFYGATAYGENLPQFVVNRFKEPPPPPPPPPPGTKPAPPPAPKPAAPGQITIAPPKKTLD